jgi:hypothetical protein
MSVVDEIIFFPDPALTLIPDPDFFFMKIHLYCRSSKHCKKANFLKICTFFYPDCLEKFI